MPIQFATANACLTSAGHSERAGPSTLQLYWNLQRGATGIPHHSASFTASALQGCRPQAAFSLASAAGPPQLDGIPRSNTDAPVSLHLLEERIRSELAARDPDLFADPSKQQKVDRIIARMAQKQYQMELAHSHSWLDDNTASKRSRGLQGSWAEEDPLPPAIRAEQGDGTALQGRSLCAGSSAMGMDPDKLTARYGAVVDKRAQEMMAEMDPALLAEVEQFKQWREARRRNKQQQQQKQPAPDDIEKLSREELVDLFGSKVADMLEAVKANPGRHEYKRKLGKYLAAQEAEERDKYEDRVVMGDPQHLEHFQQILSKLEPKVRGKPQSFKDRQAENKEVYARAVSQVDEVLQSQPCGECHKRLLGSHETVGGQGIDNVLSRFRTCTGCMKSFHSTCREGLIAERKGLTKGEASHVLWFHSQQCKCLQHAFETQLERLVNKLRGGRTVEWVKGRRRFLPLEDRVDPQRIAALEDSYHILATCLSPEEAEMALSCDYGLLLRRKGMACSAAAIAVHSPRWVQLMALATAPQVQRHHHAKHLLGELEQVLKGGGAENLAVMWPQDDEEAVEACTRLLGFRPMDARQQRDFCRTAGLLGADSSDATVLNALEDAVFLVKPLQICS